MNDSLQAALAVVSDSAASYADDLMEFVRIPSVSTDPEHRPDIEAAAAWVAGRLALAGVPEVRTMETPGHPVVLGRWQVDPELPTVIVYGHYDVQPPDPLELWESEPFEPELRDGKVFGRGASDDKGGVLIAIQAVEAMARAGGGDPGINVTFLIEGEEEVGSPNLPVFLDQQREILKADLAISADGGIHGVGIPSLTVGSRGLAGVQITVRGANADLHSGMYGGAVPNPLMALAKILAGMQDDQGRILVDGFHDGIPDLDAATMAAVDAIPEDERAELDHIGLKRWWGDPAYSPMARRVVRPTLEINGMWGGFQGEGIKTVLPKEAHAKVTCRLVVGQDPDAVVTALTRHVQANAPEDVEVTVTPLAGKGKAYQMPLDHPVLRLAGEAMAAAYGREPFPVWTGGTVPVAEQFQSLLGTWCLYYAFGEPDNGLHAPNEFFRVGTLRTGTEATVRLLHALAQRPDDWRRVEEVA